MEAYKCAYQDSKSPLTPLTPLTTTVFDFNKLTPTTRVKSAFLTPNYKTLKSPSCHSAGSKPMLLVKGQTASATKSKPTAIATRLTPSATRLKPTPTKLTPTPRKVESKLTPTVTRLKSSVKSTSNKLTPTVKKSIPAAIRLTPTAARLTHASTNTKVVQNSSTSTSTTKHVEHTRYSDGTTVVTKYQEYIVKETSTTKNKYEVSPRACLQLNPVQSNKQVSIYRAPASPMIAKGPCPRIVDILNEIGMSKYLKIFEAEEIDYAVFRMMTADDLNGIGITSELDRDVILSAVQYWSDFY